MPAHMATADNMDTGQAATYLLVFLLPLLLQYLVSSLLHLSPVDQLALRKLLWSPPHPGLRGRSYSPWGPHKRGPCNQPMRTFDRNSIVRSRQINQQEQGTKSKRRAYRFPFLWKAYQVGCCVKWCLCSIVKWLHVLCHPLLAWTARCTVALQANCPLRASA
jgi:hypothetical protein